MTNKTNKQLETQLAAIFDNVTLATLLDEVSNICQGRADQEDCRQLAEDWDSMAFRLDTEARRAARCRL